MEDHISVDYLLSIGRLSVVHRSTIVRLSVHSRPIVGRQSSDISADATVVHMIHYYRHCVLNERVMGKSIDHWLFMAIGGSALA